MTTSQPDGGSSGGGSGRLAAGMWIRLWSAAARSRACWMSANNYWLLSDVGWTLDTSARAVGKQTGKSVSDIDANYGLGSPHSASRVKTDGIKMEWQSVAKSGRAPLHTVPLLEL